MHTCARAQLKANLWISQRGRARRTRRRPRRRRPRLGDDVLLDPSSPSLSLEMLWGRALAKLSYSHFALKLNRHCAQNRRTHTGTGTAGQTQMRSSDSTIELFVRIIFRLSGARVLETPPPPLRVRNEAPSRRGCREDVNRGDGAGREGARVAVTLAGRKSANPGGSELVEGTRGRSARVDVSRDTAAPGFRRHASGRHFSLSLPLPRRGGGGDRRTCGSCRPGWG